jgi:hypothetical protein
MECIGGSYEKQNQQILVNKLNRSLNNRTESEKAWDTEIHKINEAYVSVVCEVCKKPHLVKFTDWKSGKYTRTCSKCKNESANKTMEQIIKSLKPQLPEGYDMFIEHGGWMYGTIRIVRKRE